MNQLVNKRNIRDVFDNKHVLNHDIKETLVKHQTIYGNAMRHDCTGAEKNLCFHHENMIRRVKKNAENIHAFCNKIVISSRSSAFQTINPVVIV
jgi:hypothetical protein